MTPAGEKMLRRYADAERAGQLDRDLITNGGGLVEGGWLRLYLGDGADAACARKLRRDGLVHLKEGSRGRRWIAPTEAGREALNELH